MLFFVENTHCLILKKGGFIMVQRREIVTAIILSIVTCGIYGIYWFIKLNDEINYLSGNTNDTSGGVAFLLSVITCNIYGLYWMYKMGEKLDTVYVGKGLPTQSRGILYLILSLFGFSIISYALMQDSINTAIER